MTILTTLVPARKGRGGPHRTTQRRPSPPRSLLRRVIGYLPMVAVLLVVAALIGMRALGFQPVVIMSGSMTPAYDVGDVVLSRSVPAAELRPGDVVTFRDPRLGGDLVTHRVVRMEPGGDVIRFETKGDANDVAEQWATPGSQELGRAAARLPVIGWFFGTLGSPVGRIAVIALVCLCAAVVVVRKVWQGPSRTA